LALSPRHLVDSDGVIEPLECSLAAVQEGEWAAPPLTFKLPGGAGYAAITEAASIT
jgi:hypothetical protein